MRLSLLCLFLLAFTHLPAQEPPFTFVQGAIVRGDSTQKSLSLVFTADETGEGLPHILQTLKKENVQGSFFFTGRFYRANAFQPWIKALAKGGHYLGPHSDGHLLYCDWTKRDSLLVTKDSFAHDLGQNRGAMIAAGLPVRTPHYFIPPYEWWNDSIAAWSRRQSFVLINFTPGMRTNADYTYPEMGAGYKSSKWLLEWLEETLVATPSKFNGSMVLVHAGTDSRRKDKFYHHLAAVIRRLKAAGFRLVRVDELLQRK